MALLRRRNVRRDSLVLLGSLVAHIVVFYLAGSELFHPYPMPDDQLPVQVELVPEVAPEIPPPPPPIIKPKPQKVTTPPQPQPIPKPVIPTPQKLTTKTVIKTTAPAKVTPLPSLTPTTKQSVMANLPSAPIEAQQPGPPKTLAKSTVATNLPQRLTPAAPLNLHKPKESSVAGLAPPASIPGGFSAPQPAGGQAAGGGTGAPAGPNAGPLRGGGLPPGFGEGLRGSMLGCINAAIAHLTPEQQARCAERLGTGVNEAPQMSPVGATKRAQFDSETAKQQATQKYLNSTPGSGAIVHGDPDDPRLRDTIKNGQ